MLTSYVTSPVTLTRLEATPCWLHLDGYTDWLADQRYSSSLIELFLFGIPPLGRWLLEHELDADDFDHQALARFREHRAGLGQWRHSNGKIKAAYRGARRFHEYLASIDATTGAPCPASLVQPLHREFECWMSSHRGVRERTLSGYALYISAFIDRLGQDPALYTAAKVRLSGDNQGETPATIRMRQTRSAAA